MSINKITNPAAGAQDVAQSKKTQANEGKFSLDAKTPVETSSVQQAGDSVQLQANAVAAKRGTESNIPEDRKVQVPSDAVKLAEDIKQGIMRNPSLALTAYSNMNSSAADALLSGH